MLMDCRVDRKMIAKHVLRKTKYDNVRELGKYISDASHDGEKCLMFWHKGCAALPEDYDLAIAEIEAVQAMNTRTTKEKTYHLMVSFRPKDEAKLTPEVFQRIEEAMANALGLAGHQRLCGVHKNTNNLHMHVAYNMIHPEKFTRNEPYRDFYKLAEACRAMEQEFGLVVDNGMEVSGDKQIAQRANAMEAHSGEQSFQSWLLDRKDTILDEIRKATDWQQAHEALAAHGVLVKEQGNGMVFSNASGKETMKASAFDRSLSKSKLIKRFGPFEKPEKQPEQNQGDEKTGQPPEQQTEKYVKKPIQMKSQDRDQLWKEFQTLSAERKAGIDAVKAETTAAFAEVKMQWARGRQKGARVSMMKNIQRQDVNKIKAENKKRMAEIREKFPFHNWNGFLKYRAEIGDQAALKVLRSHVTKKQENPVKTWLDVPFAAKDAAKEAGAKWDREKKKWYAPEGTDAGKFTAWLVEKPEKPVDQMSPAGRIKRLQAQERQRLTAGITKAPVWANCKYRIDNRGVFVVALATGGVIRDSGEKIHFSEDAKEAATLYALAKFGKAVDKTGNTIGRKTDGRTIRRSGVKPHISILREAARNGLRTLSKLPVVFGRKRERAEVFLQDDAHRDMER